MLSVAPVLTRCLSFVLVGKCIAVAVACVGLAAELKVARRQASFSTKRRAEHTCEPYGSNCEICALHCQGFVRNKNPGGRGQLLERALPVFLLPLFSLLGPGLLLRCVKAAAIVGSWLPQASHRGSAAFIMAEFPWEGEVIQNRIATCSFQNARAKFVSKNQTAWQSRCKHRGYSKWVQVQSC
jgi:hypothetical protein